MSTTGSQYIVLAHVLVERDAPAACFIRASRTLEWFGLRCVSDQVEAYDVDQINNNGRDWRLLQLRL